jgi:hypothetical protein
MHLAGLKEAMPLMAGIGWKSGSQVCGNEEVVKEKRRRDFLRENSIQRYLIY